MSERAKLIEDERAVIEQQQRRIEVLEAELRHHEIPFGLYRGSCGHYWDSTEAGIERCPVCAELAEQRARLEKLASWLKVTHGNTEDEWQITWKTPALKLWLSDGKIRSFYAAIDAAREPRP